MRVELTHAGERVGALVIGLRRGESDLSAADRRLVAGFAQQAAAAAYDAGLTRELRRSRERIVLAREEERRRLRQDLHDGLGPALAGISLGLETAERAASRSDPGLPTLLGKPTSRRAGAPTTSVRSLRTCGRRCSTLSVWWTQCASTPTC